ncbi:MAG TPA: hypothetical protein VNN74_02875 [Candidatus Micrarchaeia archaeon]|nr:hypothetical protein [Candidatus Micrarchaeia archaeon]
MGTRRPFRDQEDRSMNQPAPYVHWAFVVISLPNLILIAVMLGLFALALVLPFPGRRRRRQGSDEEPRDG